MAEREKVERESWSTLHELMAQAIEWLSLIRTEALALGGAKRHSLPEVHHVRRPWETDDEANNVVVLSPREFARMTA